MRTALIGYTGFVGSNLARQHSFDDLYNSQNIADINGKNYDLIVCAGARAEKWRINQEPDKDQVELTGLMNHLKTVQTTQFVLISTIDVYLQPIAVDETTIVNTDGLHPYGKHRYELEQFVTKQFEHSLIIRLPGLFGPNLKKNVIYDLLHNNNLDRIHHAGSFQYYNLAYLWRDLSLALNNHLKLVNFATEPVRTDEIALYCFDRKFTNTPADIPAGSYDMRSIHAELYGGGKGYMYSKQQELDDIRDFVTTSRQDAPQ